MKIKLDESLPSSIVGLLEKRRIDADTVVGERLQGASDARVLDAARQTDRLLLTLDRGFGDIRKYSPGTHAGIIVLRLDDQSASSVAMAVESLLDAHDLATLHGAIAVFHRGLLRIRRA
jgi:predicted nuclease of predicted toxin-antitoxin system